ncbi:methyltransferase family protein [Polluticoccus soli]|uniref:methyltransferase family protein n=1 Tax=Polluticoccus soli TaxID=3034150 RepID=UPI0023E32045|nr:isoprenylcysteine carboxylmethyltransferase family protein [Flavipsychrobacter sp. JY13-12]
MYTERSILIAKRNIRWLSFILADVALIWLAFCLYAFNAWYSKFLEPNTVFALYGIAVLYSAICISNNIRNRNNDEADSPGNIFFTVLRRILIATTAKEKVVFTSAHQKKYFLFILVKLFFLPMMVQFCFNNGTDMVNETKRVLKTGMDGTFMLWFNNVFFPLTITALFLVDTLLFTFGYLFESSKLGNRLRSVDATWSGWIVALICYPPFNSVLNQLAPQHSSTYAYFDQSITGTFILRATVLALFFVYVWASVSLGARASNLTNRGIVSKGAYKFVRHPAYISKVAAWWVTLIPLLGENPAVVTGMAVWTVVYFLRAITEERHLMQDEEYMAYCQKVKWRFVPGIF